MAELKVDVILFKINKKSSRGFFFKEATVDKFLASNACKERIKNRNALGIITHKERKDDPKYKGLIPVEDQVLHGRLFTHYISALYKEKGYLKAEITILDPDNFEGETRERIIFLQGLFKSKIKLPTSAGIRAFYNSVTKEGEEIYDIIGVDFTMSPDFSESKII